MATRPMSGGDHCWKYVKKEYREHNMLGGHDELWDPKKDWIRTVDWKPCAKEHAADRCVCHWRRDRGIGPDGIKPFLETLGINVESSPSR